MQPDANEIADRVVRLNLLTSEQVEQAWSELGHKGGPAQPLIRVMQRLGLLTPLQAERLTEGHEDGFFLGRYKLLYRVGGGSFSRVYRAEDTLAHQIVALKVLRNRWCRDLEMVRLFHREGEVAITLRHPNIVRTYGVEKDDGHHFIVMEFVEGGNLRDFIRTHGRIDPLTAVRLTADVARALTYALGRGMTHRDIKPTNILLTAEGTAKLADFGLADLEARASADRPSSRSQRTIEYATLERETKVPKGDARSDIFFLGAVLFHMLSGQAPFPETVANSRLIRRRFDNPPSIGDACPDCPLPLQRLVGRMLSFEPQNRHQHIATVLQELTAIERQLELRKAVGSSAAEPARNGPPAPDSPTILLVEPNEQAQDLIRRRLTKLGYRLLVTRDGNRGIDRFRQKPTEAVIYDLDGMSDTGVQALFSLMQYARGDQRRTPVVVICGRHQADVQERITHLPVEAVFVKPVSLRKLRTTVQKLVPLVSPAVREK